LHAAGAALANDRRKIRTALITAAALDRLGLSTDRTPEWIRICEPRDIDQKLPAGAVHQGVAIKTAPLEPLDISDAAMQPERALVILDSVTDPQNVGAIFRSAAAFGLGGVVMQTRRAPSLGGALAKAAAGSLERIPEVRAVNLARAIDLLTDSGWRVIGLDASAPLTLEEAVDGDEPLAIVMGAEGEGLRPAVAKACSGLARIPMGADMESLNVSNAAAIAFYELARRHPAPPPKAPRRAPGDDED
jgi:23S rRNA (guanosine2251-2'-O)-methyltransferase